MGASGVEAFHLARQQDVASDHSRGKAVGDRLAAEVHQHETGGIRQRLGVAEHSRMVGVDVAPGAVDQSRDRFLSATSRL